MTEAADPMWVLDADGRIIAWSRGAEYLFGYSAAEMIGESVSRITAPDLVEVLTGLGLVDPLPGVGSQRCVPREFATDLVRKDGSDLHASLRQTSFHDPDGGLRASCTVVRGLSDQLGMGAEAAPIQAAGTKRSESETVGAEDPAAGWRPCPLDSLHIIGQNSGLLAAFRTALTVADSTAAVLICGESGTGKELMARALHRYGQRAAGPFVAVNCAALPEHLLESELFGHEKGSFTGAHRRRRGRFERASGGTIFLDEIADMSVSLQAKILRTLEEHEIERVGGEETVSIDVRVIAATNHNLAERIQAGLFREDLYYRLAVVTICLPPLRDRGDDIRVLADHFLTLYACEHRRPVPRVPSITLAFLTSHRWPGNIRELRNVMHRAVLLSTNGVVLPEHLPENVVTGSTAEPLEDESGCSLLALAEVERRHIHQILSATGGQIAEAARILGIHRNTLRKKMKEYGLH
jgi:PAS domain S-box-containing protein